MLTLMSTFFVYISALAYIPPADFILQRTADTNLRIPVAIEYEVTVQTPAGSAILQEQWFIESPTRMRMRISKGAQLEIVYSGSERSFLDRQGRKSQRISPEFVERLNLFENSAALRRFMQELTIPSAIHSATPHLSRADGVVNYGFFQRSTPSTEVLNPGVWIEQDQFVLRQVRFKSGAQLNLSDYRPYAKSALLPYSKTLKWKSFRADIKVLRVVEKKKFSPQELTGLEATLDMGELSPEVKQAVLEFYSRFR